MVFKKKIDYVKYIAIKYRRFGFFESSELRSARNNVTLSYDNALSSKYKI